MQTEVFYADDGLAIAIRGALVVGIWWGLPTYERHQAAFRAIREASQAAGRPVAILSVSPQGAPIPSLADFPALARDAAAATPSILAMAIVFDGHGPWAERALDLMSTLDEVRVALRPDSSFARKFATSIEEAASWLAGRLRHAGVAHADRREILAVVEVVRARMP